jgi:hypothetical protein
VLYNSTIMARGSLRTPVASPEPVTHSGIEPSSAIETFRRSITGQSIVPRHPTVRAFVPRHPDQRLSALWKPASSERSPVRRLNAASILLLNRVQERLSLSPAPIDPRAYRPPLETHSQAFRRHTTIQGLVPARLKTPSQNRIKKICSAHSARSSSAIPSSFDFMCCQFGQCVCNSE